MAASNQQIYDVIVRVKGQQDLAGLQKEAARLEAELRKETAAMSQADVATRNFSATAKRLAADLATTQAQIRQTTASLQGLGQAGMQSFYALQDAWQGGLGSVINNLPILVSSFGKLPPQLQAVAYALTAAGIASKVLYDHWGDLMGLFGQGGVESEATEMKRLGEATARTTEETERLLKLQQEQRQAERGGRLVEGLMGQPHPAMRDTENKLRDEIPRLGQKPGDGGQTGMERLRGLFLKHPEAMNLAMGLRPVTFKEGGKERTVDLGKQAEDLYDARKAREKAYDTYQAGKQQKLPAAELNEMLLDVGKKEEALQALEEGMKAVGANPDFQAQFNQQLGLGFSGGDRRARLNVGLGLRRAVGEETTQNLALKPGATPEFGSDFLGQLTRTFDSAPEAQGERLKDSLAKAWDKFKEHVKKKVAEEAADIARQRAREADEEWEITTRELDESNRRAKQARERRAQAAEREHKEGVKRIEDEQVNGSLYDSFKRRAAQGAGGDQARASLIEDLRQKIEFEATQAGQPLGEQESTSRATEVVDAHLAKGRKKEREDLLTGTPLERAHPEVRPNLEGQLAQRLLAGQTGSAAMAAAAQSLAADLKRDKQYAHLSDDERAGVADKLVKQSQEGLLQDLHSGKLFEGGDQGAGAEGEGAKQSQIIGITEWAKSIQSSVQRDETGDRMLAELQKQNNYWEKLLAGQEMAAALAQ